MFHEKRTPEEIMKVKSRLKGKKIWLSDELTSYRSNLAFLACRDVKDGKAEGTWIANSRVLLKLKVEKHSRKIDSPSDIPK